MTKIQQEFEVWAIEHHFSTTKKPDGKSYAHDSTMCAFEGWKASRAVLCVELPCSLGYPNNDMVYLLDIEERLEKAGVSCK